MKPSRGFDTGSNPVGSTHSHSVFQLTVVVIVPVCNLQRFPRIVNRFIAIVRVCVIGTVKDVHGRGYVGFQNSLEQGLDVRPHQNPDSGNEVFDMADFNIRGISKRYSM